MLQGRRGPRSGGAAEEADEGSDPLALTRKITRAGSAELLLDIIEPLVDTPILNEFHISASWTCLAHLKATLDNQRSRLKPLVECTIRALDANTFNAQAVSTVIYGAAVLPLTDDELVRIIHAVRNRVFEKVDELAAQGVANIIWAAAKLGRRAPESLIEIVEVLSEVARVRLEDMNSQDVGNIFWAAASLKSRVPSLLDLLPVLATQLQRMLVTAVPQHLSNILWAAATLKQECPNLLKEALPSLCAAIKECSPRMKKAQDISNTVWALAKLHRDSQDTAEVFAALGKAGRALVKQMKPQEMSNSCESFGLTGVKDAAFLTGVAAQVVSTTATWTRKDKELNLPAILLGFALLAEPDEALMKVVAKEMEGFLPKAMPVTLCALAFSFEELDKENAFSDFRALVSQQLKKRKLGPEAVSKARLGIAEWNEWFKGRSR